MLVIIHTKRRLRLVGYCGSLRRLWNNAPFHFGCNKSGGHAFPAPEWEAKPLHQSSILKQLLASRSDVLTSLLAYGQVERRHISGNPSKIVLYVLPVPFKLRLNVLGVLSGTFIGKYKLAVPNSGAWQAEVKCGRSTLEQLWIPSKRHVEREACPGDVKRATSVEYGVFKPLTDVNLSVSVICIDS